MNKILIVEDEISLQKQVAEHLKKWGYQVAVAADFNDILSVLLRTQSELVLMDINLPLYDGFYWCKKIREISKVPIIFLSSRDSDMDILMALGNGGDDYVVKPFAMPVLVGKIQALLRRTYEYGDSGGQGQDFILHNGLILRTAESCLLFEEERVDLTRNELKILTLLIRNQGKIISRNDLMNLLWDDDVFVNDNTLTVNINRLRAKLESMGQGELIVTRKGQGYQIL